jgi:hypothetical protein
MLRRDWRGSSPRLQGPRARRPERRGAAEGVRRNRRVTMGIARSARVAELADAGDSKSPAGHPACGFDPLLWHHPRFAGTILDCREQPHASTSYASLANVTRRIPARSCAVQWMNGRHARSQLSLRRFEFDIRIDLRSSAPPIFVMRATWIDFRYGWLGSGPSYCLRGKIQSSAPRALGSGATLSHLPRLSTPFGLSLMVWCIGTGTFHHRLTELRLELLRLLTHCLQLRE